MNDTTKTALPKLRNMPFSPEANPLTKETRYGTKKRYARAGRAEELVNVQTGEYHQRFAVIQSVEEVDNDQFVKLYAAGVQAAFELSKTAMRVFHLVLVEYEREPMVKGYADTVYLAWNGRSATGEKLDMSEATLNRGMRELVMKGFLHPRSPSLYWVNPNLFFKGDRVILMNEFRKVKLSKVERERQAIARGDMRATA